MEKNDLRESKKEIPVYRVSSKATRLFFKVIKATSIKTNYYLLFTIYSRCGRGSKDLYAPTYYLPLTGYYLPHPTYYVLLTMYFLLQVRRWM